jgi:hypothetical protein
MGNKYPIGPKQSYTNKHTTGNSFVKTTNASHLAEQDSPRHEQQRSIDGNSDERVERTEVIARVHNRDHQREQHPGTDVVDGRCTDGHQPDGGAEQPLLREDAGQHREGGDCEGDEGEEEEGGERGGGTAFGLQ